MRFCKKNTFPWERFLLNKMFWGKSIQSQQEPTTFIFWGLGLYLLQLLSQNLYFKACKKPSIVS